MTGSQLPSDAIRRTLLVVALVAAALAITAAPGWAQEDKAADGCAPACAPTCPPQECEPFVCDPYPCCDCRKKKDPPCPPKYHNLRFAENWRPCLCKECCAWDDWSDKYKARRLTRNGSVWVNVGGQIRLRWEKFTSIGFGAPADDEDAWLLGRMRAHVDLHFGDNARIYVEGIYANQWEDRELGPRPIDKNKGDILNLFAEVKGNFGGGEAGIWAGRHELQTGKQRLVSPLDWANTRRTFQGAGGWWKSGFHRVDAWVTRPVVIDSEEFNDDWNEDALFWGLNYKNTTLNCMTWEAYFLGLNVDGTPATEHNRFTAGARIDGKIGGTRWDYDAEAAFQFGELGTADISAWMASVTLGYKPCVECWDPRLAVGFDYATGDDNPADNTAGTFNQLFPLSHKWLGHADLIARQNIAAARLEAHVKPAKKLTLSAWYHMFWRAEENDAAYTVTGGPLRAAGGSTETAIGSELDIMLKYAIDRHWVAFVEWAHFFTGDFIKGTGASDDVDVIYLSIQGTF